MKKLLVSFSVLLLSIFTYSYAQTYKYMTTDYSYKYVNDYGRWTEWSKWEKTSMLVVLSLDRNVLSIYSEEMQEYDIYDWSREQTDADGGTTLEFKAVNRDGLRCNIRFRVQKDGQKQLYIDFNNVMWVYNIYLKN